jgi:hypothetical protein
MNFNVNRWLRAPCISIICKLESYATGLIRTVLKEPSSAKMVIANTYYPFSRLLCHPKIYG